MIELNFRVVLVPITVGNLQENELLRIGVKTAVEKCDLNVLSINYSQIKKSEEEDHSEIEELSFQIVAKSSGFSRTKREQYEDLTLKWQNLLTYYSLPYSYLEFYEEDCFVTPNLSSTTIQYESISFGVLPHNGFFYQYSVLPNLNLNVIHFHHDTRTVDIKYKDFQLIFSYDNIRSVFIPIDKQPSKIYFDLCNPPIVFRLETLRRANSERKHRNLNMGFVFQPLIDTDVLGRSNVFCVATKDLSKVPVIVASIHSACSKKSIYYSSISDTSRNKPCDPVVNVGHFGCAYLLTAIIKRNFVAISQSRNIYDDVCRLSSRSVQSSDCLEKSLTSVLMALDSGKIINYWHAIEKQFNHYTTNKDEINFKDYIVPKKCCMIRRVDITPTRQLLWPAELMVGNRVLRNFDSEYSLRVSFREDNMSRLSFNAAFADGNFLKKCINDPMMDGIVIESRKYEFLAWSNSQIRDHGVWMYAMDQQGRTAATIRQWMGDFSKIRNVPKYMARMGQCFSQTEDALSVPLDSRNVRTEKDIEGGYFKQYCFSDGIGRISMELASKVHEALGHDKLCSAFQIRYGGYKGVLVVDPTLKDVQIVFRESMKKFDCDTSNRLEIANVSKPIRLYLNRQFITLLNGLGVRHRTFLKLQENMLKVLTDMLFDETEAAKYLKSKVPSDVHNYEELSHAGIYLTTEPFFKSMLLALHRHEIEKLKLRANVEIDPDDGRNMIGVLDETATLNYGEVFVQYTRDLSCGQTTGDTVVLKGEVLVTKNPCLNPGDVRKFWAVDVPALHHIADCIVFPQKGPRPHPNEMAGSDLDGDEYSVLWRKDLIFHAPNKTPADFPAVSSPDVSNIQVIHMIDFLENYIKNDQVGIIANAHLAHADISGIDSPVCLSIARKFSIAVDFAKNGQTQTLSYDERPQESPDFMEKPRGKNIKSKNALGKMYRVCKDFESENWETSIGYQDIKVDPDLVYDGWELYKDNAIGARKKYNALLSSVLRNYGIQHEAEVFSGAFTNLHCRFHERKDRYEVEKVVVGCMKNLNKCMQQEFVEEFQTSGSVSETEEKILKKASAWYVVTYSDPLAKYISFPWCISNFLAKVKLRKTLGIDAPFSPAIMCLDKRIEECESRNLLPSRTDTNIQSDYDVTCGHQVLQRALKTLILWAQDQNILEGPGSGKGHLFMSVFLRLFYRVAEELGYISKIGSLKRHKKGYSAGLLCIEFLKFCSSFRLYNRYEIKDLLSFPLYKHSKLGKQAIVTYHNFALNGSFQSLNFDLKMEEKVVKMKSIHIDSFIFGTSPIMQNTLRNAERITMNHFNMPEVTLREILQTKKVVVSARGSEFAVMQLKNILRKEEKVLKSFFLYGVLPEYKNPDLV